MNSNGLNGNASLLFCSYNPLIFCESTIVNLHDSNTRNLNPLLSNPASIQSRMVILETHGYYQDYYSDDATSGEDLIKENIENKIAEYQTSHRDEIEHSKILDDLALAILKLDEPIAIQKISELNNLKATEFLKRSLENKYAFLIDWAHDKKMSKLGEILKMYAGHETRGFSVLNEVLGPVFVKPEWLAWKEEDVASAITKRDSYLVQALNWTEIESWLKTNDFIPTPTCQLESAYEETIEWIEFQIVNELDENQRDLIFDRFLNIGLIFLKQKNFHGASQIALALDDVTKMLPNFKIKFCEYPELANLASIKNHEKYLKDFNVFEDEEKGALLPLIPISCAFWLDLKSKYEKMSIEGVFKICEHPEFEKLFCVLKNFEKAAL